MRRTNPISLSQFEGLESRLCFSPFANIRMEVNGGLADGSTTLTGVTAGQVVNYRIVGQLARPLPVENSSPIVPAPMTSINPATDGIGTVRFNIYQLASDPIQADFSTPLTFAGAGDLRWNGSGSRGGIPMTRSGGNFHDLSDVSAVGPNSVYAGRGAADEIVIATGSFTVGRVDGNVGQVRMTYLSSQEVLADSAFPAQSPGTLRYNNGQHTVVANEFDPDPVYGFTGLTLAGNTDIQGPRVAAVSPSSGASGTAALTQFLLTFSEPVQGVASSAVTVNGPSGTVPFTLNQQSANTVAVDFGPFANLGPGTYTLTLAPSGVMDATGNTLDQNDNGTGGEAGDAFTSTYTLTTNGGGGNGDGPDLTAAIVTAPGNLLPAATKNRAAVRITNAGNRPIKAKVPVSLYLTSNGTVGSNDQPIATTRASLNLRAGASAKPVTFTFKTPTGLPDGQYRYVAVVNPAQQTSETSFANNTATGPQVSYQAPFIDLATTLVLPTSASSTRRTPVSVTVRNNGNVVAKGRAVLTLLRAAAPDAATTQILTTRHSLNLKPGTAKTFKLNIRPRAVPAGTNEFLSAKADFTGAPADRDPTNNQVFSAASVTFT